MDRALPRHPAEDLVEAPNDRLGLRWTAPASPPEPTATPSGEKSAVVKLWLRVENNNQFVRSKKRARADIENYHLRLYGMRKVSPCDYELTLSYTDDANLDDQVYALLREISNEAGLRSCSIEADAREKGGERSW